MQRMAGLPRLGALARAVCSRSFPNTKVRLPVQLSISVTEELDGIVLRSVLSVNTFNNLVSELLGKDEHMCRSLA